MMSKLGPPGFRRGGVNEFAMGSPCLAKAQPRPLTHPDADASLRAQRRLRRRQIDGQARRRPSDLRSFQPADCPKRAKRSIDANARRSSIPRRRRGAIGRRGEAKTDAGATEISTSERKISHCATELSNPKIEASNRIDPLLGVIKPTRSGEVTGECRRSPEDRPRRFSKFNIENDRNRHVFFATEGGHRKARTGARSPRGPMLAKSFLSLPGTSPTLRRMALCDESRAGGSDAQRADSRNGGPSNARAAA
jgi:hypothetical protein